MSSIFYEVKGSRNVSIMYSIFDCVLKLRLMIEVDVHGASKTMTCRVGSRGYGQGDVFQCSELYASKLENLNTCRLAKLPCDME